ncbi:Phospholipase A and acyltransferase 3 [Manis javanica]|nr:Phospholipase A and acyltransferase 3 [Manis javanica]
MQPQAQVSPKYLYDARGCDLFEQITRLPEYTPRAPRPPSWPTLAAMAEALRGSEVLIELGAGNCEKVRGLCRSLRPRHFVGVDIAGAFLRQSVRRLAEEFPQLQTHAVTADITEPLTLPPHIPQAGRLLFYPGSSIGNFDSVQAQRMLGQMRAMVNDDGGLLIGIDLPKSTQWLEPAYDDAQGVTARFNLNLLSHVNSLLGSDFNPDDWACGLLQRRAFAHRDAPARAPPADRGLAAGAAAFLGRRDHPHRKQLQVPAARIPGHARPARASALPGLDG